MEYEEIESSVKTEEIIIPDRLETGFDVVIKEEFWTVMGSDDGPDEHATVDNITAVSSEIDPAQRSENLSQFYVARLPLRCRLCAIPDNDMVDIFQPNGPDNSIVEKIRLCLPVVVEETDALPKQACRLCLANLELCYQFQKTVEEAERQLIVFNNPQPEISCLSPPPHHDNIEEQEQSLIAETSIEQQITLGHEDAKSVRTSSRDVQSFDSERIVAPVTDQQNICDSEVLEDTLNKNFSLQTVMQDTHRDNSNVHPANANGPSYKCDYCSERFNTKLQRTFHTKIHIGYGPYRCSYCDKEFAMVRYRDRHQGTHREERPFKCSTCEKTFSSQSALKKHTINHVAPREYLCSLCNRTFKTLAISKAHSTNHMVETPFQCNYCDTQFMKKCGLRSHVTSCRQRYNFKCHTYLAKFQVSDTKQLQQHVFSNF